MRVLIIAPHADDEALGVGGTIAKRSSQGDDVIVAILTGHGADRHPLWPASVWETVRAEACRAHKVLGVTTTLFHELPAVIVPDMAVHEVNKVVSDVIDDVQPECLYVPFLHDLHKDHRELAYACSVAWRPASRTGQNITEIYMYETLSETHWNPAYLVPSFEPNVFVDITDFLEVKCGALSCYESQMRLPPHCRCLDNVVSLARWRGSAVGMHAAEAFVLIRLCR